MDATRGDLFALPAGLGAGEVAEALVAGARWRIERIVSAGQATPAGEWYDQPWDEWVALLTGAATLRWDDGGEERLVPGSWLWIPAHRRHRVEATTVDPPCVWLAVHLAPSLKGGSP